MERHRIYQLKLDLTDGERRQLAEAAANSDERFVDFVRRLALEGARTHGVDSYRPKTQLA